MYSYRFKVICSKGKVHTGVIHMDNPKTEQEGFAFIKNHYLSYLKKDSGAILKTFEIIV